MSAEVIAAYLHEPCGVLVTAEWMHSQAKSWCEACGMAEGWSDLTRSTNDNNSLTWPDLEGPRAYSSWQCNGGGTWHWHVGFVSDHDEAMERAELGLYRPDDVPA